MTTLVEAQEAIDRILDHIHDSVGGDRANFQGTPRLFEAALGLIEILVQSHAVVVGVEIPDVITAIRDAVTQSRPQLHLVSSRGPGVADRVG